MAADALPAALPVEPVSAADRRVIEERQLGHRASNVLAVGTRCRHGFPQAFVWDALKRPAAYDGNAASRGGAKQRAKERAAAGEHNRKIALDSGLFRLSCPLLVKAADEWEAEGAVVNLNAEVSRSPPLAAALDGVNRDHANARRVLLGPRLAELMAESPPLDPSRAAMIDRVMASGVAGQTPTKPDVKCVHAQLAHRLCVGGADRAAAADGAPLGDHLLETLRQRGVSVDGDTGCANQCSLAKPADDARDAGFWYTPAKNRWKLRTRQMRRKALANAPDAAKRGPSD